MNNCIKLALVDDEELIVTLLKQYFTTQPQTEVVLAVQSGEAFLEQLPHCAPELDVVLLDLRLQSMSGVDIAQHLHEHYPDLRVVVFSSYYQKTFMGYLLRSGVSAFLPKGISPQQLLEVIAQVQERGYCFLPEQVEVMRRQITPRVPKPKLDHGTTITDREREVLNLLCQQKTAKEMAKVLFVTPRTVEGYKNSLLSKLRVKNTAGLIIYAIKSGLVDLETLPMPSL